MSLLLTADDIEIFLDGTSIGPKARSLHYLRDLPLQFLNPVLQVFQRQGNVLRGGRSIHQALQRSARHIRHVVRPVGSILLPQKLVLNLGEAEADHFGPTIEAGHNGPIVSARQSERIFSWAD